ncbi:hypothetical protein NN561_013548 [Cricetulus griseus]
MRAPGEARQAGRRCAERAAARRERSGRPGCVLTTRPSGPGPPEARTPSLPAWLRSRALGSGKGCRGEAGLHWWSLPRGHKDGVHGHLFPSQSKGKLRLELG